MPAAIFFKQRLGASGADPTISGPLPSKDSAAWSTVPIGNATRDQPLSSDASAGFEAGGFG